ncbi:MAG: dTDP-4-dehydrorhamnose reductase [Chloroflexota bacterium]
MITGAAGLVGQHLARKLGHGHQVRALTHAALDITHRAGVRRVIRDFGPELIFNCAVLQVDESERNPAKAAAVNADGPRYLGEAASAVGAEIVQFSTQYVFAGEPVGRALYTIDDEPRPVNVYGKTKVAGEKAVRESCARSYIVRTSWVFGSGKATFLCSAHNDLQAGNKLRVIDDIWSSTTYVADLIDRCLEIIRGRHYAIYHVVNAGVCSYYEFALEAGRLVGLSHEKIDSLIEITHEHDMKRIAARPRYTPLRCLLSEKLGFAPMRDWREALAAYVKAEME